MPSVLSDEILVAAKKEAVATKGLLPDAMYLYIIYGTLLFFPGELFPVEHIKVFLGLRYKFAM